ncbi:GNAT family N-acetyltransferase [Arthrobacter sp. CDRTa11]|uniref:GNAT family N-acetyltransferase n=1 Tax=Arthrobacter sp. CDRTa11 TaxID=2651199 RepID=UPI002265F936|nr:GNAT family N-acetyltransferase [Arthrobacter sp. CDRTa11]
MHHIESSQLLGNIQVRLLHRDDAPLLSLAYARNRAHLAPWEPARADEFFTPAHQLGLIHSKLAQHSVGQEIPWVLLDGGRIIGAVTLTGIVRGPFLNAHLGYWVDKDYNGQGIGSAAVMFAVNHARAELGLHRVQAATLVHNGASRKILRRAGFQEIGVAPEYLHIAGSWQDHLLHQLLLN